MKPKILLCIALVVTLLDCATTYAEETTTNSPVSNQAPLTLTMEASKGSGKNSEGISFTLVFHNNGTNNLLLDAGQMLGNGAQLWESLQAELNDEAGQKIPVALHWGAPAVAGRIYFLGIPLRAGSSYKLLVTPNDYYVGSGERLKPAKYEIRFVYHGRQSSFRDATQMPACWEGEVYSNALKVEVPGE
jgi:hypothetical protein